MASMGNSKSPQGRPSSPPLRGADGEVYALAQGNLVVGGAERRRAAARCRSTTRGWPAWQAQVERTVPTPPHDSDTINLGLNASDFQTARKVAQAINAKLGNGLATAIDGRTVQVRTYRPGARVGFIADLEELPLGKQRAHGQGGHQRRTGSIVLNQAVTLGSCAIAHGNLSITISSTPVISQPNPLSQGQTVVTQRATSPSTRARQHHPDAALGPTGRRGARLNTAGCHTAGPAGHLAGHQGRWRSECELEVI